VKVNIKPVFLLLLVALIGWMSYALYTRAQAELLWGARPLVLFLAIWGLIVLFCYAKNRWLELATLSGILLGIGFPGWLPMPFLLFAGFVPLLQIAKELAELSENQKTESIFKYSFHTFLLWNILSVAWVANSSLAAGIFTILANSLLMTLPFVAWRRTYRVLPRLGFVPLVAYWLALEFLHYQWELHFPWLTLGNGWAQFPALVQWYCCTGVFGGSLWILIANILIFRILKFRKIQKNHQPIFLILIAWLFVPIIISLLQYHTYQENGNTIEIVALQPGYEPHYAELRVEEERKLEHCLDLTARKLSLSTDYLVFPEATFGFVEVTQLAAYPTFERLRDFGKNYPNLHFISGMNAYRVLKPDEPDTDFTRTAYSPDGNSMRYEGYNAAVQFTPSLNEFPVHKKSKLVPGPESFPFQRYLFFLQPILEKFGGTTAGLGMEDTTVVFQGAKATVAPIICYESVFGEYVTGYVRRGAQALFILTNDGWWDDTPGHRQHLYFASLRAIETRRAIARAANTGISAFINPRGDVLQQTGYGAPAAIKGTLQLNNRQTIYVRWGDVLGRVSVVAAFAFLIIVLVKTLRRHH
jgi:apolipoprotein N-acyltransferase